MSSSQYVIAERITLHRLFIMHASSISFLHRYVVMSVQPIAAAFFDIMDLLTFVVVKWWPRGLIKKLVHRMTNVRCFHAAELLSKV